jgi:hypothetical protein
MTHNSTVKVKETVLDPTESRVMTFYYYIQPSIFNNRDRIYKNNTSSSTALIQLHPTLHEIYFDIYFLKTLKIS